jgi:hypothetical protein
MYLFTKKRVLTVVLVVSMLAATLLVAGCGDSKSASDGSAPSNGAGTSDQTIGLAPKPEDGIKLTVNSGADKSFFLPIGGYADTVDVNFDWKVDWGDGIVEDLTGYGSPGSAIKHAYPNAKTTYIISITPNNASPDSNGVGWFHAFGNPLNLPDEQKAKFLYIDGILDDNAINISIEGACWYMLRGCVNLKMGPNFRFDTTRTEAGWFLASCMFEDCSSLVVNDVFTLPTVSKATLTETVYSNTFAGVTAKQNRTALEIIGSTMNDYGSTAPAEAHGTFSAAFDTTGVTNLNWYEPGTFYS